MESYHILRLKTTIILRQEYEVIANKISELVSFKVNPVIIYIIAFIYRLQISILVCLIMTNTVIYGRLIFPTTIIVCGFIILCSSTMGRVGAKKISSIEPENILLCSSYSDKRIFFLLITEELIAYISDYLFLFIPCFYLISYSSNGVIQYLCNVTLFFVLNAVVFIFSSIKLLKDIKNKEKHNLTLTEFLLKEITYLGKYVSTIFLTYFFCRFFVLGYLTNQVEYGQLLTDTQGTLAQLNIYTKFCLNNNLHRLENIFNKYAGDLVLFYKALPDGIGLILIILLLIIATLVIVSFLNIKYRKENFYDYYSVFKHYFIEYVMILNKINCAMYKNNFYISKDLLILKEKYYLNNSRSILNYIIPLSSSVSFGLLIFFGLNNDNSYFIFIYAVFFILISIFDYTSIIKDSLPIVVSLNSEMRNILLIKNSTYTFKKLLLNKINLMRILIFVPTLATCFQIVLFYIMCDSLHIYLIPLLLFILISYYFMAPHLQLYGNIFFDKYCYVNYEELYESRQEMRLFKKFFIFPKRVILTPLLLVIIVFTFIKVPEALMFKIDIIILFYLFIVTALSHFLSNKLVSRGVSKLNDRILQTE